MENPNFSWTASNSEIIPIYQVPRYQRIISRLQEIAFRLMKIMAAVRYNIVHSILCNFAMSLILPSCLCGEWVKQAWERTTSLRCTNQLSNRDRGREAYNGCCEQDKETRKGPVCSCYPLCPKYLYGDEYWGTFTVEMSRRSKLLIGHAVWVQTSGNMCRRGAHGSSCSFRRDRWKEIWRQLMQMELSLGV